MTVSGLQRQPTQLDYASPTQFKFSMIKLPKVEYFCTSSRIAGISLNESVQETRFKEIPMAGDKLDYEDLTMSFMVDENLENYREIHGWLVGLGFPTKHTEYSNLVSSGTDRFPIYQQFLVVQQILVMYLNTQSKSRTNIVRCYTYNINK